MGRKVWFLLSCLSVMWVTLAGCGEKTDEIFVISREEGSGTRSAFVRLLGIASADTQGRRTDRMTETAEITNSTGVMLTGVAENENAIGYVSMGALNHQVKALSIDGVAANAENLRNGTYPLCRTFSLVVPKMSSAAAQDFLAFVLSPQGQEIVDTAGYVGCGSGGEMPAGMVAGQVKVSGSSSVFPVMERLAEAYMVAQPEVTVVLQTTDSTTGIRDAADGLCDIGMTSRQLTEEEAKHVREISVALDGIAVIVHPDNPLEGMGIRQVADIYTGCVTYWKRILE